MTDAFSHVLGGVRGATAPDAEPAGPSGPPDPAALEAAAARNGWRVLRPRRRPPYELCDEPTEYSRRAARIPYFCHVRLGETGWERATLSPALDPHVLTDPLTVWEASLILGPTERGDRFIFDASQARAAELYQRARQLRRSGEVSAAADLQAAAQTLDDESWALKEAGTGWAET